MHPRYEPGVSGGLGAKGGGGGGDDGGGDAIDAAITEC